MVDFVLVMGLSCCAACNTSGNNIVIIWRCVTVAFFTILL